MPNILIAFIIVVLPAISKLTGLLIYNLGYSFSASVENLMKEALYILLCLITVATLVIFKKSNIRMLNGVIAFLSIVILLSIISIIKGIPLTSVITGVRNIVIFTAGIFAGYFYIKKPLFIRFVKFIFILSMIVLFVEIVLSPEVFWKKTNYFDYFLFKQENAIQRSGGQFAGYYNKFEVENMFRGFDRIAKTGVYHNRYGSILAEPIIFGHFFAAMILILFTNAKKRISKYVLFIFMIMAISMSHSKGCIVSILIYFLTILFFKHKNLRVPIVLLCVAGVSFFIFDAFREQTSAVGHITNLMDASIALSSNPLIGMGIGSSGHATDDSYIGRVISDGGLVLFFGYILFIYSLFRKFLKNKKLNEIGITLAAFIPPLLSSGAMNFVSIYLFCIYFGLQLRMLKHQQLSHKLIY